MPEATHSRAMTEALAEREKARDAYKAWQSDADAAKREIDAQGKALKEQWNRTKNRVIQIEEAETRARSGVGGG